MTAPSYAPRFRPQPEPAPHRRAPAGPPPPHLRLVDPGEARRRRVRRVVTGTLVALTCAGLFAIVALRVMLAQGQVDIDRLTASIEAQQAAQQDLRLTVAELEVLPPALDAAIAVLAPGGRCACIAYHSGEDRIVKDRFAEAVTGGCTCPPGLPCVCGAVPTVRLVWRGAHRPGPAELAANPRSESARLRVAEKLEMLAS